MTNKKFLKSSLLFLCLIPWTVKAGPVDYCQAIKHPLPCETCQNKTREKLGALKEKSDEINFLSRLKNSALLSATLNKFETEWIKHCLGGQSAIATALSQYSILSSDKMECGKLVIKIKKDAQFIGELRQHMALSESTFRVDTERKSNAALEKVKAEISHQHMNKEIAELSAEEKKSAVRTYDRYIDEALESIKSPEQIENSNVQFYVKRYLEKKRKHHKEQYKKLLSEHPILAHLESDKIDDAEIIKAMQGVSKNADKYLDYINSLEETKVPGEILDLLHLDHLIMKQLSENPSECQMANRLSEMKTNQDSKKALVLTAGVLTAGSACTVLVRLPYWCFGIAGTGGAIIHTAEVYQSYQKKLLAFESIVSSDKDLSYAIAQLDSEEKTLFFSGMLIVFPYEAGLGKAWLMAEKNPAFLAVVTKLGQSVQRPARDIFQKLFTKIQEKI